VVMMLLVLVFVALVIWLVPKIFRFVKRGFQALRNRIGGIKPDEPASTDPPALPT
jgi:flagellar biogenesis protein FliO